MHFYLLIDANDTLWENNPYFEHAIHNFITFLDQSRLSRKEVRAGLDEVERLNPQTWHQEHEEIEHTGERCLLTLPRFADPRTYF